MADDPTVVANPEPDRIAPVQQAEQRLQLVVAIRAAAGDAQEQVELGRRRPDGPVVGSGGHGHPGAARAGAGAKGNAVPTAPGAHDSLLPRSLLPHSLLPRSYC